MASPSGDPRSSALQRLLHESPAPRLSSLAGLADSPSAPFSFFAFVTELNLFFFWSGRDVSRTPPAPSLAAKKAARSGAVPAASFGPRLTDPGRDPLGPSSSSSSSSSSTQPLRSQVAVSLSLSFAQSVAEQRWGSLTVGHDPTITPQSRGRAPCWVPRAGVVAH